VRLYAVVIVAGLRYSVGVHRGSSLWAGLRGVPAPAGPFLYPTHIFYLYTTHLQPFYGTLSGKGHEG
jgi:hypothetical protein